MLFICTLLQCTLLAFAKASILFLYRTIFIARSFRTLVDVLLGTVLAWWIATVVATMTVCRPIATHWAPSQATHCIDSTLLAIIDPLPWIVTDLIIIVAPLFIIKGIDLPLQRKIALALLFLAGSMSLVASCIKYQYAFHKADDLSWDSVQPMQWNVVEASVTIFAVSLVAARPALAQVLPAKVVENPGAAVCKSLWCIFGIQDQTEHHGGSMRWQRAWHGGYDVRVTRRPDPVTSRSSESLAKKPQLSVIPEREELRC